MTYKFLFIVASLLVFFSDISQLSAKVPDCKLYDKCLNCPQIGGSALLKSQGFVQVPSSASYETEKTVEVGVWVDAQLASKAVDIPRLVLSYFELANCSYALGQNKDTHEGVHSLSLRMFQNKIFYYQHSAPILANHNNSYWIKQAHFGWGQRIKGLLGPSAPKLNILFSAAPYVNDVVENGVRVWVEASHASNGVGKGQAIVKVDPGALRNNTVKANNQDWWGIIAGHELGHAMGFDKHQPLLYTTMCCDGTVDYGSLPGHFPSHNVSLSNETWDIIQKTNAKLITHDVDPTVAFDVPGIDSFLRPYNPIVTALWVKTRPHCRRSPEDINEIQCKSVPEYAQCIESFPWSPICTRDSNWKYTQPCCKMTIW